MSEESDSFSERVDRQLGLVYQERIEDIRVFIGGSGPIIGFLVTQMGFLGFGTSQGFIAFNSTQTVNPEDVKGQLLLEESDIGQPLWKAIDERCRQKIAPDMQIIGIEDLDTYNYDAVIAARSVDTDPEQEIALPSAEIPIWADCSKTAAHIGTDPPVFDNAEFNILTPSLAAVAAGFAVTEIMRRNLLIRPSELLTSELEMRYVIQQKGILQKCRETENQHSGLPFNVRLKIGGETLTASFEEFTETVTRYVRGDVVQDIRVDPDRVILRCRFPKASYLTRLLFNQIEVLDDIPADMYHPVPSLFFSPLTSTQTIEKEGMFQIIEKDIDIPTTIEDKTVFFLGVGGIGSWTTALFNLSNTRNCTLVLNDHDDRVEEHNLNRQILFTKDAIGKPKAIAAQKKLLEINSSNRLVALPFELEIGTANSLLLNDTLTLEEFQKRQAETQFVEGTDIPLDMVREESVLADALSKTDILICGPDNIRTRFISTLIGKLLKIPVINAGAERFEGKIDIFDPEDDCYVCRYGEESKEQREVVSCTGKIPTPSIVSTIATIAGIQTAVSFAHLAKVPSEIAHYVHYYPRYQILAKCQPGGKCHHKKKPGCPTHLNLPLEENPFTFFAAETD
jgi:adenylyltransferase/sulfurtransferase